MSMQPSYRYRAVLVRVIDGDTLEVDIDLGLYTWQRRQSIRLANVWAAELRTDAGDALAARVAAWLPVGSQLVIETQKSRKQDDVRSFTRWVADAWIAGTDGLSINAQMQAMINEAHAKEPPWQS